MEDEDRYELIKKLIIRTLYQRGVCATAESERDACASVIRSMRADVFEREIREALNDSKKQESD